MQVGGGARRYGCSFHRHDQVFLRTHSDSKYDVFIKRTWTGSRLQIIGPFWTATAAAKGSTCPQAPSPGMGDRALMWS